MVTLTRVEVTHNSNKGKQLIAAHGNEWIVIGEQRKMACFDGRLGFRMRTLDGAHTRNVAVFDDAVLRVVRVITNEQTI